MGAGVASILALLLRDNAAKVNVGGEQLDPSKVQCWAYETPACMDIHLSQSVAKCGCNGHGASRVIDVVV